MTLLYHWMFTVIMASDRIQDDMFMVYLCQYHDGDITQSSAGNTCILCSHHTSFFPHSKIMNYVSGSQSWCKFSFGVEGSCDNCCYLWVSLAWHSPERRDYLGICMQQMFLFVFAVWWVGLVYCHRTGCLIRAEGWFLLAPDAEALESRS